MKKILIYLLSFILIIFIIPALLTRRTLPVNSNEKISNQEEQNVENQTQTSNQNEYNYSSTAAQERYPPFVRAMDCCRYPCEFLPKVDYSQTLEPALPAPCFPVPCRHSPPLRASAKLQMPPFC